jgi:cobalt-zinc-cadmium efflux system membrane fusion protein
MRKKYIFVLLFIISIVGFGVMCSKAHRSQSKTEISKQESGNRADLGKSPSQKRNQKRARVQQKGSDSTTLPARGDIIWDEQDVVELSKDEQDAIEIQTVQVSYQPLRSELTAMGKVLANQYKKAIVSYPFPARIAQIHVKIGDWVQTGQKLVTLQSEEVGKAKSEYYKTTADYELAEVSLEREKRLFESGVGAKKNYLSAETELKVAEANLNAAEKKLHVLGFTEEEVKVIAETHQINPIITLFSPLSGKVIVNNAVLGAMVDEQTEILIIMDPTFLWIDAEIYEKDIAKIRIGQEVEASVPAYPGQKFRGKISFISDVLNEETRTITVRAEVNNEGYRLKPGMFADIKISLNHQSKALVLPREALLDEKDEKMVFIKKDGKFFPRIVKIGTMQDSSVEILSGVQEGEEVVTTGNFQLKSKLYEDQLKGGHIH